MPVPALGLCVRYIPPASPHRDAHLFAMESGVLAAVIAAVEDAASHCTLTVFRRVGAPVSLTGVPHDESRPAGSWHFSGD